MVKFKGCRWIKPVRAIALACFMAYLPSCSADRENYTVLVREGHYLYGVWNIHSEKAATKFIHQMTQAGVEENLQILPLPIETSLKSADLLPTNGAVSDWIRSREPSGYTAENLYHDTLGGQPELYRSYGVIRQAEVEFQTPLLGSYPLIRVEIFDMGTPESAFGIYSFNLYPEAESEWIGNRAVITGKFLRFWKGKYFVEIEGYEFATKVEEGMVKLAEVIANSIEDPPSKPHLLTLLPPNRIPHSVKFFRDDATLRKIYSFLPSDGLQLGANATGVSASYADTENSNEHWTETAVAFLIRYPNESAASDAYRSYGDYLEGYAASVSKLEHGGVVVQQPQKSNSSN
ncbi:MAG: hypothetical protein OXN17_06235 [Candidatus Poribacteria bacterium]|nr:hypothetical protein [Candidatus Poribacteria bacterium]MDE0506977.1 hypothetical protein [Candidatus Poribacteria bacterium]